MENTCVLCEDYSCVSVCLFNVVLLTRTYHQKEQNAQLLKCFCDLKYIF